MPSPKITTVLRLALPVVILVVGLGLTRAILAGKPLPERQPIPEPPPVPVVVIPAQLGSHTLTLDAQGTVRARREIDLVAQVSGRVVSVAPEYGLGLAFAANETLVQIEDTDYRVEIARAQARLADARQALAVERGQAKQAHREWRDLGSKEANALFLRKPQLARAEANVVAAEAELELAKRNLQRTRISAPFAGRVTEVRADLGQFLGAGSAVARVYDASMLEVEVPMSASQHGKLPSGLNDGSAQSDALVTVPGREDLVITGVARRTSARVDERTRLLSVIVEIDSQAEGAGALLPGSYASVKLTGRTVDQVYALPRKALRHGNALWLADQENRLRIVDATLVHTESGTVIVRAELPQNASIILSELSATEPGMPLNPRGISR